MKIDIGSNKDIELIQGEDGKLYPEYYIKTKNRINFYEKQLTRKQTNGSNYKKLEEKINRLKKKNAEQLRCYINTIRNQERAEQNKSK